MKREKGHLPLKLRRALEKAGRREGWLSAQAPLVLGVSGGSDSVAMLGLLGELLPSSRLVVAHFEHGIRGEVSREDARFVETLARKMGISFVCVHGDTPGERRAHEGMEEAARRLRYDFLFSVKERYGALWIATAHTRNDVEETVLLNLFRGTGLRGLRGIPEVRGSIVRPLLELSRKELRAFLRSRNFSWREDATNEDTSYLRNYIRQVLLPQIEREINPRAGDHLWALAEDAAALEARLEAETRDLLPLLRREFPLGLRSWSLERARGLSSLELRRALMEEARLLGLAPLSRRRLESLEELIRSSGRWTFQWKEGTDLLCGAGIFSWVRQKELQGVAAEEANFREPGKTLHDAGGWRFLLCRKDSLPEKPWSFSLPLENSWKDVSFFRILSLEEWLREGGCDEAVRGIPWWARPFWPVAAAEPALWWIPGIPGGIVRSPERTSCSSGNHATMGRLFCFYEPKKGDRRKL